MKTVKTRLLFIVDAIDYGGMEKHVLGIVRRLDPSSVASTILCFGPDFYSQRLKDRPDVRVVVANKSRVPTLLSYRRAFLNLAPDVIVFEKAWFKSYPLKAFLAARLCGAKRLFTVEHVQADPLGGKVTGDGLWNELRRIAGWRVRHTALQRLEAILVDKIICVSDAVRQTLVDDYGIAADKTITIWNGIDSNYFSPKNGNHSLSNAGNSILKKDGTVILCVSRFERRKRLDLLLEAFSIVLKEHPFCKCVMVGSGPEEAKVHKKAADLGISASVNFAGFAEDVRPFLEIGDIYVSTSNREGFGISIIEAMAYKLPCVVTNIGGHSEVVAQDINGLLVTPNSAEQLAEAIKYLIVHKEERERMGINGRKRVEDLFNINNSVAKMKAVLLGEV
jgi:glycosyltransferase involved in cell wall biosynthesis